MATVRNILPEGSALIREFEGLELTAYPDPGTGGEPYTIGYGHTGGVLPGDKITLAEPNCFWRMTCGCLKPASTTSSPGC